MPALKNAKQETFAQKIAAGATLEEAQRAAGYKINRGNAVRLKTKENVANRIAELVGKGAEKAEVNIERVLKELSRIAFSDLRNALDESGNLVAPSEWSDDFASAVAAFEIVAKPGPDKTTEYIHKIRTWDKNSALEKLAKHLGMFIDRVDHTSSDGSMSPVTSDMTPKEAAEAYAGTLEDGE